MTTIDVEHHQSLEHAVAELTAANDELARSRREFLRANMHTMVQLFDEHEAGVNQDGSYTCRKCALPMSPERWEQHLADLIADKSAPAEDPVL